MQKMETIIRKFQPNSKGEKPKAKRTPHITARICCMKGTLCNKGSSQNGCQERRNPDMKISPDSYSNYLKSRTWSPENPNTSGDWEEGMTAPSPPTKYLCLLKITLLGVEWLQTKDFLEWDLILTKLGSGVLTTSYPSEVATDRQ